MSEIVPSSYTAVPTVTLAPNAPANIQQFTMDFGTPYLVNRQAVTSKPYIPGRTLPYTPGMGETNPFITQPSYNSASASARPMNAPVRQNLGVGGAVGIATGALSLLPSFQTALQNIGASAGNIGDILQGNEPTRELSSHNPYFDEVIRRQNEHNAQWLDSRLNLSERASNIPRNAPDFLGRARQEAQRFACSIFGLGCPEITPEGIPTLGSPGQQPAFYGGQSAGVSYWVDIYREQYNGNGSMRSGYPDTYTVRATGAVQGLRIRDANGLKVLELLHNGSPIYAGNTSVPDQYWANYRITRTRREDGQPDTGGNPAIDPNTPYQPARSPAIHGVHQPNVFPSNGSNSPINPNNLNPSNPVNPATQPVNTNPGNPLSPSNPTSNPPVDTDDDSPLNALNPLLPFIPLGLGAALAPSLINRLRNPFNGSNTTNRNPFDTNTTTLGSSASCRFHEDTVSHSKLDLQYAFLQLMEANQTRMLNQIDTKLGEQMPNGGISSFLKKFFNMFSLDRILNILTFVTVLHNAFMLSNAITQTLFSAFDQALELFKVDLKDADDQEISVSEWVGDAIDTFFKSILGDQTVEEVKVLWRNANRIYQAAMNIVYSLQSIMDSITSALEAIGNYVALIGNALRKFGGVAEKAYGWMNPNNNFHQGKFWTFLNNTQEAVEVAEQVTSEALNITEEVSQIQEQQQQFTETRDAIIEQITEEETTVKEDSQTTRIDESDLNKPEE